MHTLPPGGTHLSLWSLLLLFLQELLAFLPTGLFLRVNRERQGSGDGRLPALADSAAGTLLGVRLQGAPGCQPCPRANGALRNHPPSRPLASSSPPLATRAQAPAWQKPREGSSVSDKRHRPASRLGGPLGRPETELRQGPQGAMPTEPSAC